MVRAMVGVVHAVGEHLHFGHCLLDVGLHEVGEDPHGGQRLLEQGVQGLVATGDGGDGEGEQFGATAEWGIGEEQRSAVRTAENGQEYRFGCCFRERNTHKWMHIECDVGLMMMG